MSTRSRICIRCKCVIADLGDPFCNRCGEPRNADVVCHPVISSVSGSSEASAEPPKVEVELDDVESCATFVPPPQTDLCNVLAFLQSCSIKELTSVIRAAEQAKSDRDDRLLANIVRDIEAFCDGKQEKKARLISTLKNKAILG